ncbi:MAG: hypothetical protein JXR36_15035 [Bacteroidales bacterium]|nr:hypothetical protein [Bacteroidales bacterium]
MKTSKNTTLLLTFLFLVFLTSCHQTVYVDIPEEYYPVYGWLDTVIMKSNLGNYDTLVCKMQSGIYMGRDPNIDAQYQDTAFMTVTTGWERYGITISSLSVTLSSYDCNRKEFYKIDTLIEIDTIREQNVFVNVCQDTCETVKEFYSAKYGLLEYRLKTGEIYKIHKYIKR